MQENIPKISIITPTFNSAKDIEACILSVAEQNYSNKEHLIMDGQSTDETLEIAQKYADKYEHIKIISEKDEGIYDAMNKGIDLATGQWVYFLGSDDILFDNKVLEKVSQNFEDFDVVYGNVKWGEEDKIYDGRFSPLKLMQKNICHQAIFFRKNIFDKLGKFETRYKVLADWVFNIRWINSEGFKNKYVDVVIAKYCTSGFSSQACDGDFMADIEGTLLKVFPNEYEENFRKIKSLEKEIIERKSIIQQKDQEINLIKSSKFWKARDMYMKIMKKGK